MTTLLSLSPTASAQQRPPFDTTCCSSPLPQSHLPPGPAGLRFANRNSPGGCPGRILAGPKIPSKSSRPARDQATGFPSPFPWRQREAEKPSPQTFPSPFSSFPPRDLLSPHLAHRQTGGERHLRLPMPLSQVSVCCVCSNRNRCSEPRGSPAPRSPERGFPSEETLVTHT